MSIWKILSPLLMMLLKRLWAALFGKRNRALVQVEADEIHVVANGVTFDLPKLKSIGLDEEKRVLFISDGRTVLEIVVDDISELDVVFREEEDDQKEDL